MRKTTSAIFQNVTVWLHKTEKNKRVVANSQASLWIAHARARYGTDEQGDLKPPGEQNQGNTGRFQQERECKLWMSACVIKSTAKITQSSLFSFPLTLMTHAMKFVVACVHVWLQPRVLEQRRLSQH